MCLFKASKYEVGLDVSRQYICTRLKNELMNKLIPNPIYAIQLNS